MEKEVFQILINHEGKDISIVVDDMETAQLLLNDHDAAQQFLNHLQQKENENILGGNAELDEKTSLNEVWCRKKPNEIDLEATAQLLKLRNELSSQFNDKKTVKAKLWLRIAQELKKNFNLGDNGAEKCRQKFSNLQRCYLNYVKHQKTTGSEKNDDIPPFFEELHSILGSKDKVNPVFLVDTLINEENNEMDISAAAKTTESVESEDIVESQPSTSKVHVDRFKTTQKRLKPSTKTEVFLKEFQAEREMQQKQFTFFQEHLKKTEDQRQRFLEIIQEAFCKKRKRSESSDSD